MEERSAGVAAGLEQVVYAIPLGSQQLHQATTLSQTALQDDNDKNAPPLKWHFGKVVNSFEESDSNMFVPH